MDALPETDGFVDLREQCGCGCKVGRIHLVGVGCADCGKVPSAPPKTVRIAARYEGRCKVCGAEHEQGHWVWWQIKTTGVMCAKCNELGGGL